MHLLYHMHETIPQQSLGHLEQAIEDWRRAIAVLPIDRDLTPVELKQKDNYEAQIAATQANMKAVMPRTRNVVTLSSYCQDPGKLAIAMLPMIQDEGRWNSSVSRDVYPLDRLVQLIMSPGLGYREGISRMFFTVL